jgi:ketosteroid isomerase-like protein
MKSSRIPAVALIIWLAAAPAVPGSAAALSLHDQVWAAEVAFARTMAQRDLKAFSAYVSDEAIFFSTATTQVGKASVIERWTPFFTEPGAPFSWEPDQVAVLASGTLALSTGPVRDPEGKIVSRYNSIWRLEADHRWRVVFDKGSPLNPDPK